MTLQSLLRHILFVAVTLLGPRVGAGLLERWFLGTFPRYATTSPSSSDDSNQGLAALEQAMVSLSSHHSDQEIAGNLIGLDTETLVQTLIRPTSITPHASLASLLLLAAGVSGPSDNDYASLARTDVMNLLQDSMPVLSAALSGSAVDAGAVWTWQLLDSVNDSKMDHGAASMLLEVSRTKRTHQSTNTVDPRSPYCNAPLAVVETSLLQTAVQSMLLRDFP